MRKSFFQIFDQLLTSPIHAVAYVVNTKRYDFAFAGYFIIAVSFKIFSLLGSASSAGIDSIIPLTLMVLFVAFLHSAFANIILETFNGRGSALGLFNILGTCGFVFALLVPLALLGQLSDTMGYVAGFGYAVVFIWYIAFVSKMISKYYNVNSVLAFISMLSVLFMPLILIAFSFIALVAFIAALVA